MVKEYFKSLSNISTNSVDSGYSDDEITEDQDLGATMKIQNPDDELDLDEYTELENDIIDYCEEFWCEPIQPIVRLPQD
ncbi:hypothetical protein PVAND_007937 [Polypedilum vanderplanki]|uniref:Uncharacterized protein n=1 Tax=Polypedilum vanderplanki TaxID=319348 RepID=A0A9J6C8I2_POLVA|nr:hypothetical protein PVAND_007937 [Polypedilum vanderplanki]